MNEYAYLFFFRHVLQRKTTFINFQFALQDDDDLRKMGNILTGSNLHLDGI